MADQDGSISHHPSGTVTHQIPHASSSQILRAGQRDTSQIQRLVSLTSDLIRSFKGSTWLMHREVFLAALVKAVYLLLTFGRGTQTLGEEYTDLLPVSNRSSRISLRRRLLTILLLVTPSFITSPRAITWLRGSASEPDQWTRLKLALANTLESSWCQLLPELHMVAFMFGGRFLELGERLTGVSYVSMVPESFIPTYEPLGLLLLISMGLRRLRLARSAQEQVASTQPGLLAIDGDSIQPGLPKADTLDGLGSSEKDEPNTYLSSEALRLPGRQCALCFEPRGTSEDSRGTVAVTECGHVFCWGCLGGLEKAECPLCRQELRMERLLAAYNL